MQGRVHPEEKEFGTELSELTNDNLAYAVFKKDFDKVKTFLHEGKTGGIIYETLNNALHVAIEQTLAGDPNMLTLLLQYDMTDLLLQQNANNESPIELLLAHRAELKISQDYFHNLLSDAVRSSRHDIVEVLIEGKINIPVEYLDVASSLQDEAMILLLLKAGCRPPGGPTGYGVELALTDVLNGSNCAECFRTAYDTYRLFKKENYTLEEKKYRSATEDFINSYEGNVVTQLLKPTSDLLLIEGLKYILGDADETPDDIHWAVGLWSIRSDAPGKFNDTDLMKLFKGNLIYQEEKYTPTENCLLGLIKDFLEETKRFYQGDKKLPVLPEDKRLLECLRCVIHLYYVRDLNNKVLSEMDKYQKDMASRKHSSEVEKIFQDSDLCLLRKRFIEILQEDNPTIELSRIKSIFVRVEKAGMSIDYNAKLLDAVKSNRIDVAGWLMMFRRDSVNLVGEKSCQYLDLAFENKNAGMVMLLINNGAVPTHHHAEKAADLGSDFESIARKIRRVIQPELILQEQKSISPEEGVVRFHQKMGDHTTDGSGKENLQRPQYGRQFQPPRPSSTPPAAPPSTPSRVNRRV